MAGWDTLSWDTFLWDSDSGGSTSGAVAGGTSQYPTPDYSVVVTDIYGAVLEEIPTKDLQYTLSLNDAGSVSFSMSSYHPKCNPTLMQVGARNILVYRNATLVWGGRLWTADTDAEINTINFGGNGWFSLLLKRYVNSTLTYSATDQFDIAWGLIQLAQSNGALGITRASTAGSGITRTRTYPDYERKNIGEALQDLSSVNNGFDFEITPDLQWKTYYPNKGKALDNIIFELGKNVRGYSMQYDATNMANELTGIGSGDGAKALRSVQSNAASIATYGLMQDTRSWTDVRVQATLNDHTKEELRVSKLPITRPEFSVVTSDPPFGSYLVGDTVPVRIQDGYNQIDQSFRITTLTVAVADSGFEAISVFFDDSF